MQQHYFGLPPEEGFTYGNFLCPSCGFVFVSNRGQEMYCPACGSVANYTEEVPESELPQNIREVGKCETCTSPLATSAPDSDLQAMGTVYCPQCGSIVTLDLPKASELQKQKSPTNANFSPEFFVAPQDLENRPRAEQETQITMTLHRCPDKGPFWNIIIDGNPVARVYLKDQPQPEEIQPVFESPQYEQIFRQTAAQFGINEALASVNARFYAVDETKVREKVEQEVKAHYEAKFNERIMQLRDEFRQAVNVALAGMNKNIWPDIHNELKAALYSELVKAGVENPTRYIEAAFERSADRFFATVVDKALEIMAKPKEVRAEIEKLVATASVQPIAEEPTSDLDGMSSHDIKQRLVQGNFGLIPPKVEGQAPSDVKEIFRSVLRRRSF